MTRALLIAAFFILVPTAAQAATAYATENLHLRAGPDGRYPSVGVIRRGERVELLGCIAGEQWCEVETRDGEHGWTAAYYLRTTEYGRTRTIIETKRDGGLRIIIFQPHDYWDRYYRQQYFYRDRDKWLGHRPHDHDHNHDHDWHNDNDNDGHHGHHGGRPDRPKPEKVKKEPKYPSMGNPQGGKYKLCPLGEKDC